jgi:shikimate 5-dehydrogenase
MLLEQGMEQFELWTARCAPVHEMARAVYSDQVPKIDSA